MVKLSCETAWLVSQWVLKTTGRRRVNELLQSKGRDPYVICSQVVDKTVRLSDIHSSAYLALEFDKQREILSPPVFVLKGQEVR